MKEHIINIAYDRQNLRYVAYSLETNLFGTGVCVTSAVEAYKNAYYERQAINTEDGYLESLRHAESLRETEK